MSNTHTKFGWISSNGLGGDSGRMDVGDCNIPGAFLKKRGDNKGVQWLSGGVLDSRLRGDGFEPHRRR